MKKNKIMPGLIAILVITALLAGCRGGNPDVSNNEYIPSIMIYTGTKFVNCHLSLKYPIQTDRKLTVLTGVVERVQVSKMNPVYAVSINGQILYPPEGFSPSEGKKITVKGYLGDIDDTFLSFHGEKMRIFYVVDVIGWQYICCNHIDSTGTVSAAQTCFWFEEGTIKGYTIDPAGNVIWDKLITDAGVKFTNSPKAMVINDFAESKIWAIDSYVDNNHNLYSYGLGIN